MSSHRSRLRRSVEETRLAALYAERTPAGVAQFSAGLPSGPFGNSSPYHAAQDTRLRAFSGESLFGARTKIEEEMLRPYDRVKIISRARVMVRNNPWLAALLLSYVQEIGEPTYKSGAVLANPDASRAYNDKRERLFARWATDCESENNLSLDQVIRIYGFESAIAGEMFEVTLRTGEVQLIPSELCGSEKNGPVAPGSKFQDGMLLPPGCKERYGIVRNAQRRIIGYRFARRDEDSGAVDFSGDPAAGKTVIVPAAFVRHLYDPDRCEQGRGVPLCAPLLTKMQDLYETGDARAQQVKNAACLSLWVTKNIDPLGFAEAMRGAMRGDALTIAAELKAVAEKRSGYQSISAGSVYYGGPGEDVKLIEPKLASNEWREHYIDLLQVCAACLNGMPVEVGVIGFRDSNYSSSRATVNKWRRNVTRVRRFIVQKLLDPLQLWLTHRWEWFGDIDIIPTDQAEECSWGWPAIPDIDGLKTSMQNAADLAIGATTLRKIYADKGEHSDVEIKAFITEKGEILRGFIAEGITSGLTADQARGWALTQVGGAEGIASLIFAAGALTNDNAPAVPSKQKPAA